MPTEIKDYSQENYESLRKGINMVADLVKITLGPNGKYVVIEKELGPPLITADGATIIDEIDPADKFEALGAEIQQDIARKVSEKSGDGRTAACIITKVIVNEGFKNITAGASPIQIKRGLLKAKEAVMAYLDTVINKNATLEQIGQVAGVSAGDKEIGKAIAHIMNEVGKDGIISVEESKVPGVTTQITKGFQFERGYLPPHINTPNNELALQDVPFFVTDKTITEAEDVALIVERLLAQGTKQMVIIAEDVAHTALKWLNDCKTKGVFITIIIKKPGMGEDGKNQLEDLAIFTGTKIMSDMLAETPIENLGKAERVVTSKNNTIIIGGAGKKDDIDKRVVQIKTELEKTEADFEKTRLKDRIARLTSGIGILKVGYATDTEHGNIQKIKDALNAANGAGEEGIITGGGSALVLASIQLDELKLEGDQQIGVNILKKALEAPMKQLAENSGDDGGHIVSTFKNTEFTGDKNGWGYNAETGKIGNLAREGIIDSAQTVKATVHYPVMAIATLLNAGAGIVKKKADN